VANPKAAEPQILPRKDGLAEILPDAPSLFHYDAFCAKRLGQIVPGKKEATTFHRLAELVLRRAFRGSLDRWETEKEVDEGRGRIDLFARNHAECGFFDRVRDHFGIRSPYVSIECKNYTGDVGNAEMNQLSSRLDAKRGQLGLLVCRGIKNPKSCLDRARYFQDKKSEYIIVLTDDDLKQFCAASAENDRDATDELMEKKLQALLL